MMSVFKQIRSSGRTGLPIACFLGMLALLTGTLLSGPIHAAPIDAFDQLLNRSPYSYIDTGTGEYGFVEEAVYYANIFRQIVIILAIILIIIEGFRMIQASGDAAAVKKAGTAIAWILGGIIVMNVAEVAVSVFFRTSGAFVGIDPIDKNIPQRFYDTIVLPLARFGLTFLAGIATLMIVITGVRILTAAGDDAKIKKLYVTLATLVTGLFIIILSRPIVNIFYGTGIINPAPERAIGLVLQVMNYVLGFLGLAAVIVIVVAGLMMVFYLGNDAVVKKARTAIFGAILGLALIISAYTIATFFVLPAFN